jgi:hypothetical protein
MAAPPPYNAPAGNPYGPPQGYVAPPPQKSNRGYWIAGVIIGVLALCCLAATALGVGGALIARRAAGNVIEPGNATSGYFDAVRDHNWTAAQGYLDSQLRAANSPATLQATWTARELTNGRVTGFSISNTHVSSNNGKTTATISGTLNYARGTSEFKTVNLVKEGGDWKLSALP